VVFALKLGAYFLSGSVALLSDALESISNIAASFIMFMSVRASGKPADEEHQYGHYKIENMSALVEGALVAIAGLAIAYTAIGRIFNPVELGALEWALVVSILATACNYGLSWYLSRSAKEHGSLALEGDSKHLLSDVLSSVGVVMGLVVAKFTGWTIMDPLLALVVAGLVLKMGAELLYKSANGLLDQSSPEEEAEIRRVLDSHRPSLVDYHNLRTRRSGNRVFAELHLCLNGEVSVQDAHDFTDHLQDDIRKDLPNVVLNIHVEPPDAPSHD
jgi:cation diffusion facilitator family transporter